MNGQRLIKHNPLFMSHDELEAAFVVRTAELEILTDLVRANKGEVNQHALVLGPRGMGKTMLMQRLALLVRSDERLRKTWYPIVAPEEIYDAATEGEIWLAVLKSLADQERREGGEFERWNERHEALVGEHDEERLRARTLGALTEFSDERGKRLLVLIENLQMLLGEQFAKDADWDLRKTLLNRPEIMLVMTATTRFEEIEQPAFAAFELFRELELKPLSTGDCRRLWMAVSGQDLSGQRIRPMEILTGGNPRLLAILATFAPGRSLDELVDHLAELIDDHTPFLKSNIDALPPQERRVFVNLAKLWEPSTARRVGERCRLPSNTTSAVLKSLLNRGAVVEQGKEGRGKLYQVAERIYCIYYLMRLAGSEADRMRAFVRFMVPLYGEDSLARSLADATCAAEAGGRTRFIEGFRELLSEHVPEGVRRRVLEATPRTFFDLPEVQEVLSVGPITAETGPGKAEHPTASPAAVKEATGETAELMWKAVELNTAGRLEEAVEVYDDIVRRFGDSEDPAVLALVAWALVNKGVSLGELDRSEEAIEVYDLILDRYGDRDEAAIAEWVAKALVNKGVRLGTLDRSEEAIEVYDLILDRYSDRDEVPIAEPVAKALVNKGMSLGTLDRSEEAIAAYDLTQARYSDRDEIQIAEPVARALLYKGVSLGALERSEEAIEVYDLILEQYGDRDEVQIAENVARALNNKCWLFYSSGVGRLEEAIEAGKRAVALAQEKSVSRHTLASVYGLASRWDEAFDQIEHFIDDEAFVESNLDDMLALMIDAAADGQAESALDALAGTAAERAMEPLVAALKDLTGQKFRAPQEVEAVKKDVLARIEERRGTGGRRPSPGRE